MRDAWSSSDADIDLVVVTFASPRAAGGYGRRFDLGVPVLSDENRTWYGALGFPRGRTAALFRWQTIATYVSLMRKGRRIERPTDDISQLGGDAVVDGHGRISWIFRSVAPDDRPTATEVMVAARSAATATGEATS